MKKPFLWGNGGQNKTRGIGNGDPDARMHSRRIRTTSGEFMFSGNLAQLSKMHATHTHGRRRKLLQAVPVGGMLVSERRPVDGILADEVFNARPSLTDRLAEAALMCAVLEDAVDCFQKQFVCATRRAKYLGWEAEQWLFSNDPHWLFSFLSICSALDLCPQYIRQGLKRWPGGGPGSSQKESAGEMTAEQRAAV